MALKKLIWLFLVSTCFAQVSVVGTVGGYTGYKLPYAEASVEAKHRFPRFLIGGELRGASGRKSDTGDGFHLGTRAIAAYSYKSFDFGGGIAFAKQWTSLYQKQAVRPVGYIGWHEDKQEIEGFWIFKGTDSRNGEQGLDFRFTNMVNKHWGYRVAGELLRGYATDQPKLKSAIGGGVAGIVYRF